MNTEITLKGIQLTRSGYSKRGFTSAAIILAASHNSSNKTISVKYMGCHIGYISHVHFDDLLDGRVELRGDISFPLSNLIAHREILNNKDVYPVCIIETASDASEAQLSEVILFTEEERQKILSDIKGLAGKPEITFDEKGRYDGEGLMRYGHYRNGALMGYITVRASAWGEDFNSQDLPYILQKFIAHQRKKWGEVTNRWSLDEM
ncbi:TPA: hypothetical protein ACJGSF_002805 [Salmonella enterica subsp. enterica serovar Muenchen]|nr:hypothetical protein [Salmonella enterica]